MKCPLCGNKMFGCGTFGFVWNCECGYTLEGTRQEKEAYEQWFHNYRQTYNQHASFSRPAYVDDPGEGSEE